ncbi:MAG: TatD family hydrolase [Colwellia sp.]|nr:TatD family hydrolase [Colwellia sp.]
MMDSLLHDTHLHLDLYEDIPNLIKEIEQNKIHTIAVTNLPVLFEKLKNKVQSKHILLALGFHPELISEYKNHIPKMWKYLANTKYIGEVGLELKNSSIEDKENQINFFKDLIQRCDDMGNKVLSVHSRGGEAEIISIIGSEFSGNVILHWYSGALINLKKAINCGYYFSINYSMVRSNKGRKIIGLIPNEKLLIESDGPFIKMKNRVFRPKDLNEIIVELAKLKNISTSDMNNILHKNFKQLLQ